MSSQQLRQDQRVDSGSRGGSAVISDMDTAGSDHSDNDNVAAPITPRTLITPQSLGSTHYSPSQCNYHDDYENEPLLVATPGNRNRFGRLAPRHGSNGSGGGGSGSKERRQHNSNGGGSGDSPSKTNVMPIRCHLSRREKVIFALGCVSTLLVIGVRQLLYGGMERSNGKCGDDSELSRPADNDRLSVSPAAPPFIAINDVDSMNSDQSLLKPILGNSYRKFLSERTARFEKMRVIDPEKCRHPKFFDYDYTYHNLTKGSYAQEWSIDKVRSHFRTRKKIAAKAEKKTMAKLRSRYLNPPGWNAKKKRWNAGRVFLGGSNTSIFVNITASKKKLPKAQLKALQNKPPPRSITFVHIGKAGGSSILCNIKEAFKYGKVHCPGYMHKGHGPGYTKDGHLKYAFDAHNDSAISAQVSCYVHYDERMHCYDNPSFLVNVRNPIHRLASWYLYEHSSNFDVTVDHVLFPSRKKHCGQQMLFACYPTFDSLATIGLAGEGPPSEGELLRIGRDLSEHECSHWAWAGVRGRVPTSFHNLWNYEWYLQHLLNKKAAGKSKVEVFVLRIEHLDDDWSHLDRRLGGTGAALPASRSHANDASEKNLPVSNKTVSSDGMANLCKALCREIQVYKQILKVASNLNKKKLKDSLRELQETCPEEKSLEIRECEY